MLCSSAEITNNLFSLNYPESYIFSLSTGCNTVTFFKTAFFISKNKIVSDKNRNDLGIQMYVLVTW